MPEHVYTNRCAGRELIHVELTWDEIREMMDRPAGPAAVAFWQILDAANRQFQEQYGPCPAGLMSLRKGPIQRCVIREQHTVHQTSIGEKWMDVSL